MAYLPDPTDATQPVASVKASTAAEEFRALKTYIAGLAGLSGNPSFASLTVQQLNGGQLAGLRNKLINGQHSISQRHVNNPINLTTTPTYITDRWAAMTDAAPSGTLVATRADGDSSSPYCLRLFKASGNYTGLLYAGQVIESMNCAPFIGKPFSLSFRARVGSSFTGTTSPSVYVYRGTVNDEGMANAVAGAWTGFTSESVITVSAPTLNTFFQTYKYTGTISGPAGELFVGMGRFCDTSAGSGNDYMDITDVQFEIGTAATPFETLPYGMMLALCQRYYHKTFPIETRPVQNVISSFGALSFTGILLNGLHEIMWYYPVPMRSTSVTITTYSPNAASNNWVTNGNTPIATLGVTGHNAAAIRASTAVTVGASYYIHATADAEL